MPDADPATGAVAGSDAFIESLMDTDLYSMGAFFCDQHPELVDEVVRRSVAIEQQGLERFAEAGGADGRGGLQDSPHRPRGPLLHRGGRLMEAAVRGAEARRGRWFVAAVLAIGAVALSAAIVNIATQKAGPSVIELRGSTTPRRSSAACRRPAIASAPPRAGARCRSSTTSSARAAIEQFLATVPALVDDYVRSGDVQLDYRNYSFSERAVQEGFIAAEAAGEQGYLWQYVYLLFRNQAQAERFGVTGNLLESIANSIGELDVPQWKDDFAAGGGEDGAITKRLEAQDETARGLGLRAEPSAIVNGPSGTETLQDSPTLSQIEKAIEAVS